MGQGQQTPLDDRQGLAGTILDATEVQHRMLIEGQEVPIEANQQVIEADERTFARARHPVILAVELQLEVGETVDPPQFGDRRLMTHGEQAADHRRWQKRQVLGPDAGLGTDEPADVPADQPQGEDRHGQDEGKAAHGDQSCLRRITATVMVTRRPHHATP